MMADQFSDKTAADAVITEPAEEVSLVGSGEVCSNTEVSPRPLSQFIMAKQQGTISTGSEEIRSSLSLSSSDQRPPEKNERRTAPVRRHVPPCRVEYPLYDGDSDETETDELFGEISPVQQDSKPPHIIPDLSVSAAASAEPVLRAVPVSVPSPPCSFAPAVSLRALSEDEIKIPLPCDHFRFAPLPIFERYLAVCARNGS